MRARGAGAEVAGVAAAVLVSLGVAAAGSRTSWLFVAGGVIGLALFWFGLTRPAFLLCGFLLIRPLLDNYSDSTVGAPGANPAGLLAALMIGLALVLPAVRRDTFVAPSVGSLTLIVALTAGLAAYAMFDFGGGVGFKPVSEAVRMASLLAVYFLASNVLSNTRGIRAILVVVGFSGVVPAILALIELSGGPTLNHQGLGRVSGPFNGPNPLGMYLALSCLVLVGTPKSWTPRLARWIALVIMVSALVPTYSRVGYICFVGGLLLLVGRRRPQVIVAALAIAAILVALIPTFRDRIFPTASQRADTAVVYESYGWRIKNWKSLLEKWTESPIIGYGTKTTYIVNPRRPIEQQFEDDGGYAAHNAIVRILVEGGVVLLLAYIIFAWTITRAIRRLRRLRWPLTPVVRLLTVLWLIYGVVVLFTDDPFEQTPLMFVLFALTGALEGTRWRALRARPAPPPSLPPRFVLPPGPAAGHSPRRMVARIGVMPAAAAEARPRLLAALADALGVELVPCTPGAQRGLDAVIAFGPGATGPRLEFAADAEPVPGPVAFEDVRALDGLTLEDAAGGTEGVPALGEVRASGPGGALWTVDGDVHYAAVAPAELGPGERLANRVRAGDFLSLVPLIAFLREVAGDRGWTTPATRGLIVFDDPNLQRSSYGHLDFDELAASAQEHGYHAAIAMVPIDGAIASVEVAQGFGPEQDLSLLVHGNAHFRNELLTADRGAIAQALQRIGTFESRTGVPVQRFMVPPHEQCGPAAAEAMLALGFEGLLSSGEHTRASLGGADPLAGFFGTERVAGGLPVITRHKLMEPRDDWALRAFVGGPLVLYAHHADAAHGLGPLTDAVAFCQTLGVEEWGTAETVVRAAHAARRTATGPEVRLDANRAVVAVPEDGDEISVRLRRAAGTATPLVLRVDGGAPIALEQDGDWLTARVVAAPGSIVELAVGPLLTLNAAEQTAPRPSAWGVARRALFIARDRSAPRRRR